MVHDGKAELLISTEVITKKWQSPCRHRLVHERCAKVTLTSWKNWQNQNALPG